MSLPVAKKEGSIWFRRLLRELVKISPYLRARRINNGFYRIYWKNAYIHEVYKDMPMKGYDKYDEDPNLQDQKFFEEYVEHNDRGELTRNVKNFVEGYYDSIDRITRRLYMLRNDSEFFKEATKAYQQVTIK